MYFHIDNLICYGICCSQYNIEILLRLIPFHPKKSVIYGFKMAASILKAVCIDAGGEIIGVVKGLQRNRIDVRIYELPVLVVDLKSG